MTSLLRFFFWYNFT